MRKSIRDYAALLGVETTTINNWRSGLGSVRPRSMTQGILDTTLERRTSPEDRARFDQIVAEGEAVWRERHGRSSDDAEPVLPPSPSLVDLPSAPTAIASPDLDGDYVESLHSRIRQLVDLDATFGGDQSSGAALQLFRSVHRKLGVARCEPAVERDLYAAAGELGEVVGWLLYDAGEHELVRQVNSEALQLSRLAGDRSIELLTLQNMSMHAGYLGRPVEALRIARMVLGQESLSPRLEAMFRVREARALARGGDQQGAARAFAQARSRYLDGVTDNDPAWVWWINDQELGWHEAMVWADDGKWARAVDAFHASAEAVPRREIRSRYIHLASLFSAQIHAHAWREAEDTLRQLVPLVDEVRSSRTATGLLEAIDYIETIDPAPPVRAEARQLRKFLEGAGYGRPKSTRHSSAIGCIDLRLPSGTSP
ncbi:XRE family transcriptional regulator [Nocardia harenae]|uniref:XRE family transcriptional regulator n=1 Tax=Nocardia harenae TaxID=358707 RepID=UPI0012EEE13F|nr:XRE family transcriptional regulator [Nocardia harenae]